MQIRTPESLAAIALFYPNKKILYIEDSMGIGFYENYIDENLNEYAEKITIKSAGSKENVKEVYKILKSEHKLSNSIYIVDLDYEKFLKKEKIEDHRFMYLEKYTLENYMISKESLKKILSKKCSVSLKEAEDIIDYDEWISKIESCYRALIPIFLTLQSLMDNKIPNSGAGVGTFFKKGECEFCEEQMKKYWEKVEIKLTENSELYKYFIEKIKNDSQINIAIPGKQLLTLFRYELNKKIKNKIMQDDDLKVMLSSYIGEDFLRLLNLLFERNIDL